MIAVLCDATGKTLPGSDGYIRVDGRQRLATQIETARRYREGFRQHFPYQYDTWTHVMFVKTIRDLPDPYNKQVTPARYRL
jgi:hypothetical protein